MTGWIAAAAAALALVLADPAAAAGARRTPKASATPLDFSGTWTLDGKASVNVSPRMENAVLKVSQRGDRIYISPGRPKMSVMAEEIVADGEAYEKSLGNGRRGIVRAAWGSDGGSLRLEIVAGDSRQRSVWKLSSDRSVWIRDTSTLEHGTRRDSRLVFRRQVEGPKPGPAAK
jgi:hypothetical protein